MVRHQGRLRHGLLRPRHLAGDRGPAVHARRVGGLRLPAGVRRRHAAADRRGLDAGRRPRRVRPLLPRARPQPRRQRPGGRDPPGRLGVQRQRLELAGAGPDTFKAYWRNIVTAMRSVEGQKFEFDWNVNASNTEIDASTTGRATTYVDYVGVDVYDLGWEVGTYPYPDGCDAPAGSAASRRPGTRSTAATGGWRSGRTSRSSTASRCRCRSGACGSATDGHGGGDNPFFIEKMHAFITDPAHNIAYQGYFDVDTDDGQVHALKSLKTAGAVYRKLFRYARVTAVGPAGHFPANPRRRAGRPTYRRVPGVPSEARCERGSDDGRRPAGGRARRPGAAWLRLRLRGRRPAAARPGPRAALGPSRAAATEHGCLRRDPAPRRRAHLRRRPGPGEHARRPRRPRRVRRDRDVLRARRPRRAAPGAAAPDRRRRPRRRPARRGPHPPQHAAHARGADPDPARPAAPGGRPRPAGHALPAGVRRAGPGPGRRHPRRGARGRPVDGVGPRLGGGDRAGRRPARARRRPPGRLRAAARRHRRPRDHRRARRRPSTAARCRGCCSPGSATRATPRRL